MKDYQKLEAAANTIQQTAFDNISRLTQAANDELAKKKTNEVLAFTWLEAYTRNAKRYSEISEKMRYAANLMKRMSKQEVLSMLEEELSEKCRATALGDDSVYQYSKEHLDILSSTITLIRAELS